MSRYDGYFMQYQVARRSGVCEVGRGDGWRWRKSWGWGVGGLAGCCHPAVCRMKAHSGVNLLEELESSAGCHLFSTLSTPPPTPPPFSFSPVNRVISTALVLALQPHISLSLSLNQNGFTFHCTYIRCINESNPSRSILNAFQGLWSL